MIHAKEEIIEKTIQIMDNIDWRYDANTELNPVLFSKEKAYKYIKNEKQLQEYLTVLESYRDYWSLGFDFELETELENNTMFLSIWDDTGEPFEISHKQAFFDVRKDDNDKYYTEFRRYR